MSVAGARPGDHFSVCAQFFGPFVGVVEIVCGTLLIIGLLTRLAAIPLLKDILVAIATTKIPMLSKAGFWAMMHEARLNSAWLIGGAALIGLMTKVD